MIIFGGNNVSKLVAPGRKYPRARFDQEEAAPTKSFGIGAYRQSSVFTTSMIEPNWIYTSTENATLQTFDVKLMWGDTSEPVDAVTAQPVQFTVIASS